MAAEHYDLIVIGSGPGGASLAQSLAPTGKRILMLERGGYLPRSRDNWNAKTVFVDGAYQAPDTWYGPKGDAFHPGLHYYVGGNSKVYGSALFRLRERDFSEIRHKGGISPAWPARLRRVRALLHEGGGPVPRAWAAGRGPDRAVVQRTLRLPARPARAAHPAAQRHPAAGGPAPVPPSARHQAGPEPRRQRDHLQPVHPLRRVRRFSLRDQRQGRCAGDLRRSDAGGPSQLHSPDRRLRVPSGNRSGRAQRQPGPRDPRQPVRAVFG